MLTLKTIIKRIKKDKMTEQWGLNFQIIKT